MPCCLAVAALFVPRAVILVLWLFSSWFTGLFDTVLWPILGFIFLPTTLLWYTAVQHWFAGQWTPLTIIGLVLALATDLSPGAGRRPRRREA